MSITVSNALFPNILICAHAISETVNTEHSHAAIWDILKDKKCTIVFAVAKLQ